MCTKCGKFVWTHIKYQTDANHRDEGGERRHVAPTDTSAGPRVVPFEVHLRHESGVRSPRSGVERGGGGGSERRAKRGSRVSIVKFYRIAYASKFASKFAPM